MSDNWLQYIPKSSSFQPTAEADASARSLLSTLLPEAESIDSTFQEGISFFEGGAKWSGVQCPICGTDAESWWGDAMDEAFKSAFSNLQCIAQCCGSSVSLDELKYLSPAGFGSYALEAMNPNSEGLSEAQLARLEVVLGCELREIPLHI